MSVPVPRRFPGRLVPPSSAAAPLAMEFYADMQCPYSKKAWKTMKKIAEHFQGRIRLTFIPYAVVGHQQAYDVHRALEVVGRRSNPEAYYVFVDLLFANQSEFGNPQFKTKSPLDLLRMLAAWTAPEPYAISLDDLSAAMEDDATFDAVKAAQRRGISLGVWCTPTCYLNGSLVTRVTGTDETSTWIEYLEALAE